MCFVVRQRSVSRVISQTTCTRGALEPIAKLAISRRPGSHRVDSTMQKPDFRLLANIVTQPAWDAINRQRISVEFRENVSTVIRRTIRTRVEMGSSVLHAIPRVPGKPAVLIIAA